MRISTFHNLPFSHTLKRIAIEFGENFFRTEKKDSPLDYHTCTFRNFDLVNFLFAPIELFECQES